MRMNPSSAKLRMLATASLRLGGVSDSQSPFGKPVNSYCEILAATASPFRDLPICGSTWQAGREGAPLFATRKQKSVPRISGKQSRMPRALFGEVELYAAFLI
jgi:hypothetical protein